LYVSPLWNKEERGVCAKKKKSTKRERKEAKEAYLPLLLAAVSPHDE